MTADKNDKQNPLMLKLYKANRKMEKFLPRQVRERFEDYEVKRMAKSLFNGAMESGRPKLPRE